MNLNSFQEIVMNPESIIYSNQQFTQYLSKILLLFKTKLRKGQLFDVEKIIKQIQPIFTKQNLNLSNLLLFQIYIQYAQFYIKKKNRQKIQQILSILKNILNSLDNNFKELQIFKLNSLILYDFNFPIIQSKLQNNHVKAIMLYKQNKLPLAIDLLKKDLNKYEDLTPIKKVLIGKMYIEIGNVQCFQWLDQNYDQYLYQKFQAQLIYVSGYRLFFQKLKNDFNQKKKNFIEDGYNRHTLAMSTMNKKCSEQKIIKFKQVYSKIKNKNKKTADRKQNIVKSLALLKDLPCYPSPSLYQLQINYLLLQQMAQTDNISQCRKISQKCIKLTTQLGLYNWKRQKQITICLVHLCIRQNNNNQAIFLLQRCIQLTQDLKQIQYLQNWKASLAPPPKKVIKSVSKQKLENNQQPLKKSIVKKQVIQQKPQLNKTQQNLVRQKPNEQKKPIQKKQQSSCCTIF